MVDVGVRFGGLVDVRAVDTIPVLVRTGNLVATGPFERQVGYHS